MHDVCVDHVNVQGSHLEVFILSSIPMIDGCAC